MQPILNTLEKQPDAQLFCKNLVDRAGLLADYGETDYIFRHKSFREYLAGVQMTREENKKEWIRKLILHFGEDWWEEPLRFFMCEADDAIFDQFMAMFFASERSKELQQKSQNLLQTLVREAPQKKIDSLAKALRSKKTNSNQQRYILECLKTIGTPAALTEVNSFIKNKTGDAASMNYAREMVTQPEEEMDVSELFTKKPSFSRNPVEDQAQYIFIPGGKFKYSVSKKTETVADLYLAKYLVTNKRYRIFISYLENKHEKTKILHLDIFAEKLLEFSQTISDYTDSLGSDFQDWPQKLRSRYEDEKRFNQDDQPVVGVTWFAARAYCFWLSCLHAAEEGSKLEIAKIAKIFRLPTELEWEWVAAGREKDGSLRKYPWAKEKGEPDEKLANYDSNVGATTPVGRYPEGATPEGLMDMAGNVWEWMENYYDKDKDYYALRGGSWGDTVGLRCSARIYDYPDDGSIRFGFRVVRPRSDL